jgi:dUTP pyrophosphatase
MMNENSIPKVKIRVLKLAHFKGELPSYQTGLASGFDIRACLTEPVILSEGERALLPTGLSFEIPPGYEIQARPRSGWAIKQGITLLNSPGTIDADYRGEVKIIVINHGGDPVEIKDQDRIAQLVLCPVVHADFQLSESLTDSSRGAGGFGSTGLKG